MIGRVLITGATGFVGSAVARAFLKSGYMVRAFVRPDSDLRNLNGLDLEMAVGDLARPDSFPSALSGCSGLVHVGADYRLFVPHASAMYKTNVEGTKRLLEEAVRQKVDKIVYTSSVATIGHRSDNYPADESVKASEDEMIGPYKRSKFLAEQWVGKFSWSVDPDVVIVNPSTPVGPRDIKPTPTGRMVYEAARGRTPAYIDTGLNVVHVDDVAEGHRLAYERGQNAQRYILGGDNLSLKEIFELIARLSGRRPPMVRLAPSLLIPVAVIAELWALITGRAPFVSRDELAMAKRSMYFDSSKAERELGYSHRIAELAFRDALAWAGSTGRLGRHFQLHCKGSQGD